MLKSIEKYGMADNPNAYEWFEQVMNHYDETCKIIAFRFDNTTFIHVYASIETLMELISFTLWLKS